jgi:hypothetical protein
MRQKKQKTPHEWGTCLLTVKQNSPLLEAA